VIGHTEGTAGLAAIMKVSLALQHRKIPPNMWFSKLNPSISPHYDAMQIPTALTDWPTTSSGTPRRASINSFGFGGTNAHAILESYDSPPRPDSSTTSDFFIPLVFSAKSKRSLLALLQSYKLWLSKNLSICLRDLAFNLLSRRSQWPVKAIFSARSTEDLVSKIEDHLRQSTVSATSHYIEPILRHQTPRILGIFTGQGAQWAGMGRDLLLCSEFARSSIFRMDRWLSELPYKDRPSWSLQHELMKDASTSRINEAEISQPVCTAIQILLVNILNRSGLKLQAVIGHSSGELAAAYAAGFLTAKDSLYAAYYRGVHAKLGCGIRGQHGGMLAVGTTPEDARELCDLPYFKDRVTVAAHNSSSSITLSGDRDRIDQAQLVFEDENRFARLLKVERAYHSHHMIPCETSYVKSIERLEFRKQNSRLADAPQWFSSVTGNHFTSTEFPTAAEYWKANMLQPVLFHEAVTSASLENGPYDLVIEIGPHPALKSPVSQTLQELSNDQITYTALLKRDTSNVETLADGLGSIWQRFPEILDLTIYDKLMSSRSGFQVLRDLPSYCWDHDKQYWNEPRQSIAFRSRGQVHELLGHLTSDSSESLYRWRHILRVSEIPWLEGHKLQGQVVFPAAGYVVTALEAALTIANDRRPSSIEVQDLEILQALTFNENTTGVEIIFSISNVLRTHDSISATFLYEACLSKDIDRLSLIAKGSVQISFVSPISPLLPQRVEAETYLMEVGTEQFYSSLLEVGYEYTGPFKALSSLKRKYGYATGTVSSFAAHSGPGSGLVIHPGTLDATIQAILLAHCYPNDGTLWSLHIPTAIKNIFLDLALIPAATEISTSFPFDSIATGSSTVDLTGDVDLIAPDGNSTMLRVEGLRCSPLSTATAAVDRKVFSYERWINALPDCHLASSERSAGEQQYNLALALERIAFYYMGEIERTISEDTITALDNAQKSFLSYIKQVRSEAPNEHHPYVRPEWRTDTFDNISPLLEM
jgi:hybrid polyketide synthase/nonribosomal peptide synthetase ACE1